MKKTIVTTIILFLAVFSLHAQNIVVIGEVEDIKDGIVFNIQETTGSGISVFFPNNADENNGKVIGGRFILNHKCQRADSRHFALESSQLIDNHMVRLEFWANQGDTVYVKGKGPILGNWEVKSKAIEQKEFDIIRKGCAKELAAFQQACYDYENYRQYRRDTEMTEEEWDNSTVVLAQKDTLRNTTRKAWLKKELEIMKQLPVTDLWMDELVTIIYLLKTWEEEFKDQIQELYILKSDKIDRKADGKVIRSWLYPYPKAELGKVFSGGELFDTKGTKYKLEDFRGKYILLDFWAQYCSGCIEAFPILGKIQEKYADKLTIISISVDKVNTWKVSPHQKKITWYSLCDGGGDNGGIAGSFNITSLPCYILIAPDGTYKARLESSEVYSDELIKYINGEL